MDPQVCKTPPTSTQPSGEPEVTRTRSKRAPTQTGAITSFSSPSRPLSPRDVPLPISLIPNSPYLRVLSPSSSPVSSKHAKRSTEIRSPTPRITTPRSPSTPPARPPRPPTSLSNIRPTIILSPLLVPALPPADRPFVLKGKTSFSSHSTSLSKASLSTGTRSSTWDEQSYSTLSPPSPCFFAPSTFVTGTHSSSSSQFDHRPNGWYQYQRRPSLPIPPKPPRSPHHTRRRHNHGYSHSSSSDSAPYSSSGTATASASASAKSSPSSSLIRLSPPHPPSPSPYPPPTSPLPLPPSPSPLARPRERHHSEAATKQHRQRHTTTPTSPNPDPKPEPTHRTNSSTHSLSSHLLSSSYDPQHPHHVPHRHQHYHSQRACRSPTSPQDQSIPPDVQDDIESLQQRRPRWRSSKHRHLWMLVTAAVIALMVGGILGGVLWRLSRG